MIIQKIPTQLLDEIDKEKDKIWPPLEFEFLYSEKDSVDSNSTEQIEFSIVTVSSIDYNAVPSKDRIPNDVFNQYILNIAKNEYPNSSYFYTWNIQKYQEEVSEPTEEIETIQD